MEVSSPSSRQWLAIRVTYGRELKFCSLLDGLGYETFVPMSVKVIEKDGRKFKKTVPAVNNLCFVKSGVAELRELIKSQGEKCPARFIWDKATRNPIVIPEKAMADFIKISGTMAEDLIYMTEVNPRLRSGQKVRVISGPFAGVEGTVVRIRKSRRIFVEITGVLAVATTYIPQECLEPV